MVEPGVPASGKDRWKSHAHACAGCYRSAGVTRRSRGCRRSGVAERCRIDHLDGEREACSLTSDRVCLPTASKLWGSRDESTGPGVRNGRGARGEPGLAAAAAALGTTFRWCGDRLAGVRARGRAERREHSGGGPSAERAARGDGRTSGPSDDSAGAGGRCRALRTLRLARRVRGRRGPVRSAGVVRSAGTVTGALRVRDGPPVHRAAARAAVRTASRAAPREHGNRDDLRGAGRGASSGGTSGGPHLGLPVADRAGRAGSPGRRVRPQCCAGPLRCSGSLRDAGWWSGGGPLVREFPAGPVAERGDRMDRPAGRSRGLRAAAGAAGGGELPTAGGTGGIAAGRGGAVPGGGRCRSPRGDRSGGGRDPDRTDRNERGAARAG